MLNMDCLIKTIEMEEIYKYICEISIKLGIKKENLIKLWCEEQKIYESVFDEYLALKYVSCPSCHKMQLVSDEFNFHCTFCPHYNGYTQCIFSCCYN